jgi:hypothetical protein
VPQSVRVETPEERLELEDFENHAQVEEEDGGGGESNVGPIFPVDEAPSEPTDRVEEPDTYVHL